MKEKKNTIIIIIASLLLVFIVSILLLYNKNVGLEKINYEQINKLMENE